MLCGTSKRCSEVRGTLGLKSKRTAAAGHPACLAQRLCLDINCRPNNTTGRSELQRRRDGVDPSAHSSRPARLILLSQRRRTPRKNPFQAGTAPAGHALDSSGVPPLRQAHFSAAHRWWSTRTSTPLSRGLLRMPVIPPVLLYRAICLFSAHPRLPPGSASGRGER